MIKKKIRRILDNIQTASYERILAQIENYSEISFDVFDTLIKRDVPNPADVFNLMEQKVCIENFAVKRIEAEIKARRDCSETTLEKIYLCYDGISKEQRQSLINLEIEYETNLCTVNQDLKLIYEEALKAKRVFIISDMYLSREVIENILFLNGISGYEALIISNEVNMTKADGRLYKYVKDVYKCSNILHIGNDFLADYISAKRNGFSSCKIRTNTYRIGRKFKGIKSIREKILTTFISNHTASVDQYFRFGYERFGSVLYGFTHWLHDDFIKEKIDKVYFLSRDGYILKKVYDDLAFDKDVPDEYFEVSRRSLRVPAYIENLDLSMVLRESPLLSTTNMEQLFDSLGLCVDEYDELIQKYGFTRDEHIKRMDLENNELFNKLYNEIKDDIQKNAEKEFRELEKYIRQFDFDKNIAIVDIGWGGSIQHNLILFLNKIGICSNITGYYMGLSPQSRDKLGNTNAKAKGYLFDCLNNVNGEDMAISFRALLETFFLEQGGSVKFYDTKGTKTTAVRYPYEYCQNGAVIPEAANIKKIQEGALQFIKDYHKSVIKDYIQDIPEVMFKYIYQTGINPNSHDVNMFGDIIFFNNGSKNYLASGQSLISYLMKPYQYIRDLSNAQWKLGFLKRTLKLRLPYLQIYNILHKISNRDEHKC